MPGVTERRIHQVFEFSIVLKGLNALVEVGAGLFLLVFDHRHVTAIAHWLEHRELVRKDVIIELLIRLTESFSVSAQTFAIYYLISHGAVKLVLVWGLLRNKTWAYPASLVVLGLFIAYQLYRMTWAPSIGLALLTAFDVLIVGLIWHEYRLVRRHIALE